MHYDSILKSQLISLSPPFSKTILVLTYTTKMPKNQKRKNAKTQNCKTAKLQKRKVSAKVRK